jgi:cell division transport system permease protein
MVELFKEQLSMEVFIDNSLNEDDIKELQKSFTHIDGVESVIYISRQQALERFKEQFKEDPLTILGENPLPSSFQIKLKLRYRTSVGIGNVAKQIQNIKGVDEVVYHGKLFQSVDRYSRIVLIVDGVLLLIVSISALFLISNTLRLTILAQKRTIQIMELIGATRKFIRRPYLLQGLFQGFIGGMVSSIVVWLFIEVVTLKFPRLLDTPPVFVLTPLWLGLVLGFLGSRIGVRRFLKD